MNKVEFERMLKEKYGNMGALVVSRDDEIVYQYYNQGCDIESPFHVFSVTKSVISILIGIAIDKGYIKNIDQKVLEFFPDYTIKRGEKTIQQITLRDLLTMTAPYKYKFAPYTKYFTSGDWVKASLDLLGGKGKIGEFRYTPLIGPDIFAGILVNSTGMSVLDFARKYLFEPLEINIPGDIIFTNKEEQMEFYKSKTVHGWVKGPTGVHTAGFGLAITPKDMIKLGKLYLNGGCWNGTQIVSKEWITESTKIQSRWEKLNLKYGLLWWIIDEEECSFAALGDGGNAIYVNSKEELVVVIGSYFKPRVPDVMELIKDKVEPMVLDGTLSV
ncbi:MAG: serine hydrolase [Lachnospiraceae bacterium]|nr:serine hydrolase [Lachnospiraceae bacterium]